AEEIARLGAAETDRAAFGLDAGATRVEVRREGGEPVVVTIGGANPTGTAVYAQRQGAADVVLIGRNVRYYDDLIFHALPVPRPPRSPAPRGAGARAGRRGGGLGGRRAAPCPFPPHACRPGRAGGGTPRAREAREPYRGEPRASTARAPRAQLTPFDKAL